MDESQEYATILALCRERAIELKLRLAEELGYIRCGQWADYLPSDGTSP